MPDLSELAFEAVCSALYNLPFVKFLGERPDPVDGSNVAWFLFAEKPETRVVDDPKKVRVAVRRHPQLEGVVEARAEWPNVSGPAMVFGEETFHIPTLLREQPVVQEATEGVVLRLLELYADVIGGVGKAGPIEKVPASPTDMSTDEDDLDVDPSDATIPEGTDDGSGIDPAL